MLEGLFPDDVITAWGDPEEPAKSLFAEEEALIARAIPKRRREFEKGRECARVALARLGMLDVVLLTGSGREPLWPAEVVGSITHSARLCAVAVGRAERYSGIGIDTERAEPLKPAVEKRVCRSDEEASFDALAADDRGLGPLLIFSAKESLYKCLFPLTRAFMAFEDVRITLENGAFSARLRRDFPPFRAETDVNGRWRRTGDYVLTSAWVSKGDGRPPSGGH